jgi:transposase
VNNNELTMRRPQEKLIAGIDLHSNNLMIGLINQEGQRVAHRKLECDLKQVVQFLQPWKRQLQSMAVESTFNWYWLVDGLRAQGYPIDLANPAKIEPYKGIKHADDQDDAFHLAELQRLKILPKAHVYDPELRPVRDLLRRRISLVQQRTRLLLSFKSLYARTTGQSLGLGEVKAMDGAQATQLYEHPANQLIAQVQVQHMEGLDQSIRRLEKVVLQCVRALPCYPRLLTLPGIGRILAMTITMEVGSIERFASDGQFASYCRMVDAQRMSNGKSKGDNNAKCGNKYLCWAFIEASNFARRHDAMCRRWYDRKAAKTSKIIATKALGCKLAKAAWHVMSHQTDYDPGRMFPEWASAQGAGAKGSPSPGPAVRRSRPGKPKAQRPTAPEPMKTMNGS